MSKGYLFDEKFFDQIDTPEKAWLLGLFASDGNIKCGPRNYKVRWKQKDFDLVELIKTIFPTTNHIRTYYNKGNLTPYYGIEYGSKYLVRALQTLGFTNKKSYECKYPKISSELDIHFIRGMLDGDGTISKSKTSFIVGFYGTENMICNIRDKLGITTKIHSDNRGNVPLYSVFSSGKKAISLCDKIYENSEGLRLERKFNVYYMERMNHVWM